MLALLYGCGLTGLLFAGQEILSRLESPSLPPRLRRFLVPGAVLILLAIILRGVYPETDAVAHNYSLYDRRNDLTYYMDTSLPPGKYITDRGDRNHSVFNRPWGGYTGEHDYPLAQEVDDLFTKPLETWRAQDAVYAIVPYPPNVDDPDVYFPDDTVRLKSYLPDPSFRDPGMVVLRLYPMQNETNQQVGPIQLVGYDINATRIQAGEDILLRHYWQRRKTNKHSTHHVYNHLLNADGEIVTQTDYVPLWDARRDTTTWDDPDEIMLGREFELSLPTDLPPGSYQLVSGFYDPLTWQRLTNDDGEDHVSSK